MAVRYQTTEVSAARLATLPTPFDVRFASGWKTIHRVEAGTDLQKLPTVVLFAEDGGLVASFYPGTAVRVNRQV